MIQKFDGWTFRVQMQIRGKRQKKDRDKIEELESDTNDTSDSEFEVRRCDAVEVANRHTFVVPGRQDWDDFGRATGCVVGGAERHGLLSREKW